MDPYSLDKMVRDYCWVGDGLAPVDLGNQRESETKMSITQVARQAAPYVIGGGAVAAGTYLRFNDIFHDSKQKGDNSGSQFLSVVSPLMAGLGVGLLVLAAKGAFYPPIGGYSTNSARIVGTAGIAIGAGAGVAALRNR